ncbi:MAG TPA: hypothetical protein VFJ62_16015 [Usitatibacter sp.]|nr:hypothetical protein [Usitatibacter sp.]
MLPIAATVAVVVAALMAAVHFGASPRTDPARDLHIAAAATAPQPAAAEALPAAVVTPGLVARDGSPIPADRLRGRWSLLYAPSDPCSSECQAIVDALSKVAHDPASGVPDGGTQILLLKPDENGPAVHDLVVMDPDGHSAGLLLHTADAGRIVAGLASLRAEFAAGNASR